jgi:hypothetical protein
MGMHSGVGAESWTYRVEDHEELCAVYFNCRFLGCFESSQCFGITLARRRYMFSVARGAL